MDISRWKMDSDTKWLQTESGNGEEREQGCLGYEEHYNVQQRFKENRNNGEKVTGERIEHFRNEMSLQLLYELAVLKLKAGKQGEEDNIDGSFVWLIRLHASTAAVVTCLAERVLQAGFITSCLRIHTGYLLSWRRRS